MVYYTIFRGSKHMAGKAGMASLREARLGHRSASWRASLGKIDH